MSISLSDITQYAMIDDLDFVTQSITGKDVYTVIDAGFIKVGVRNGLDVQLFVNFLKEHTQPGKGAYGDMTMDDLAKGPSYIALGGWLGDQTDALIFMAIGKHIGAWDIIGPGVLGITGPEAQRMMGMGFLTTSGFKPEFRALLDQATKA